MSLTVTDAESIPFHLSCNTAFRLQNTPETTLVEDIKWSGLNTRRPCVLFILNRPDESRDARMLTISPV